MWTRAALGLRIRRTLEGFDAYGWETPSRDIAAEVGLRPEQIVRLDTNTSPYPPLPELRALAKGAQRLEVNQYPDTTYLELREGLSRYCRLGVERFVVTNGADEGLDITVKVLLDNGDEVVVPSPTYSMFAVASELMGARVKRVWRDPEDFAISADKVLHEVGQKTRLVFLCNPNSPTGNATPLSEVEKIAAETKATLVVDEAYHEFGGATSAELTEKYDNVVVCRTFSKAFSMAGVRVGYLIAGKETVEQLNLARPPNSLTVPSLFLAQAALRNLGEMRRNVERISRERSRVFEALSAAGSVSPFPSVTNFVLFRVEGGASKAKALQRALMRKGLVLRAYSESSRVGDCLRLTIGTRAVNSRVVAAIREASR